MPFHPAWRTRIFSVLAAVAAVWMGFGIAEGDSLPLFVAVALAGLVVTRWVRIPLGALLLGAILAGYIVGNRGFAQIALSPSLPVLPAEGVLALGGLLLCVQSAWRHELPFRRDPLNLALLLWMVIGTVRIALDVRTYGFLAVRDFATVYYAAFFFLVQDAAREPASRKFLATVLLASCAVLLPLSQIYDRFPDLFLGTLTLRGIPVIFYKGDLVGTFLALGSILFFLRYEAGGRVWNVAASLLLTAGVLATANRASMLGLVIAAVWLAAGRRWRYAAVHAAAGLLASALVFGGAAALNVPMERTPLYGVYERAASLLDFTGQRTYRSDDALNKGDNNLFRRVWWQTVIDETIEGNPWIGLGFGADLADRFVREYYADNIEEFSARSPHNVLLTVFARMGLVGLIAFLVIIGLIAARTWQAVRAGPEAAGLWCCVWVMLASACLGVVLEGPMGAVVFWTVLGLAQGQTEGTLNVQPSTLNVHVQQSESASGLASTPTQT